MYYYDNGIVSRVPLTDEMVKGYDKDTAGTQTLAVEYGGETYTFDVTVKAAEPEPIAPPTAVPTATAEPAGTNGANAPDPDNKTGSNGWIVPVVIAAAAVCAIIVAVAVILKKRRRQGQGK